MVSSGQSTPLPTLLNKAIKDWATDNIETFDVAVVTDASKYDQRLVSVLPLCIQEYPDGISPAKPTISDCPVVLQGNLDGYFSIPLRRGDKVIIGYPKDSIEEFTYASTAEQYFPVDTLKFQGSQAIVLGAIGQVGQDKVLSKDSLELAYFNSKLTMTPTDSFSYSNPSCIVEASSSGTITLQNAAVSAIFNADGTFSITGGEGTLNGATVTASGNLITASGADLDEIRLQLDSLHTAYIAHGAGAPAHPPPPAF